MISFLYAVILAAIICWLIIRVVKIRRLHQIKLGDGEVEQLIQARSAHSNAVETIPITLILLLGIEYNGAPVLIVHLLAILFVISRIVHAKGILQDSLAMRKLGMQMTMLAIAALAIVNLVYLPYAKLLF